MVGFEFLSSASVSVNHFISVVLLLVLRYFHAIHSSLIEPNIGSCSTTINKFRVIYDDLVVTSKKKNRKSRAILSCTCAFGGKACEELQCAAINTRFLLFCRLYVDVKRTVSEKVKNR